jgi:hypothetical protein
MKVQELFENGNLGLTIFDIDDTLFRTTAQIKVVKDGKIIKSLNNQEFNTYKLQPGESFDFGEFQNAEKFNKESIPIEPMIAKLKAIINNAGNSKVIMLTARSDFDNKELFLDTFRKYGIDMSRVHVHRAGNLGGSPSQNKAVWIRKYLDTGKFARVRLYDDAMSNIKMFINLQKEYPDVKFFPYFVTHEGSIKTIREDGRIVKGVNTTVDVGPNEIKTQAAKFGNTVDRDGRPPTMSKAVKGKSTNVLYNLGLAESSEPRYTAKEWAIMEGGHSLEDIKSQPKKPGRIFSALDEYELEDRHPNERPVGPEIKPTMPKGTIRVKVSDVYDWYKLGQHISDLEGLGKHDFGKGPPEAVISFGSEDQEHKYIALLKKLGLDIIDVDPGEHGDIKGIEKDSNYNVGENFVDVKKTDNKNYLLQLERDKRAGMLILHILDKDTGKRTEVRGKMGYETNGYDPNDKLHQLLDKVGKSASVSDLMNGDVVSINPRHPDGASAKAAADRAHNEAFDTEVNWVKDMDRDGIEVFATKVDDAYIELTYKRMANDDVYIAFSRGGRSSVTGEGGQNKIFGAVINHITQHIGKLKPPRIVFSAFKPNTGPFGTKDTTRSSLYRKMVQRFAGQNGYEYDVEDTGNEDTFILTRKNVEETRSFQPQTTPLQALVLEYLTFTSTGIMTIVSDGAKSPQAAEELKKVFQTLNQSNKKLQAVANDKQKLEANKTAILKNIYDMMTYAIAHLKANMIPQEFDSKKKQINSVLTKYNDLTKNESVEENFADGKKPGRKGLAKRSGVNTKASVSSLRKTAKNSSGEKQRMAHWLANMKAGRKKAAKK